MTEHCAPKKNSVMVLSAAAATGHLRAADALVSAFDAKGVSARHIKVLRHTNPIPGQEERNTDHFLEEGVGIRCNNLPALAYKIDTLLSDQERFSRMQQAVRRLARPHAAFEVVSTILRSSG
jgi:UDP-N-acetylglucosamine:LPS N-acetylglucosamine transferase